MVTDLRPGEGLVVATGAGRLLVREVQPAGGRAMDALAYARGRRLEPGGSLE
jgi:methionyl-tRNA formyltransferase